MNRLFATKPKINLGIKFDEKGEKLICEFLGLWNFIRVASLGIGGYLYAIYSIDKDTRLGSYRKYSLSVFGVLGGLYMYRCSKFLHKLVLLEGGQFIKIEKYPLFGFGHLNREVVNVADVRGITRASLGRWYNPLWWGHGYYRLRYRKRFLGQKYWNSAFFKIGANSDLRVLKLLAVGKPVNAATLRGLATHSSKLKI